MRATRLLFVLFLIGCTCGEPPVVEPAETPSTETTEHEPTPTEPTPTEPATDRPARVAQRPDPAMLREVRRLVREARVTEHAGDHVAALALFDQALRLVPAQPRVLCEAGFIAHRAGRTTLAAQRIDTALRVFNSIEGVDAEDSPLRVPHAMCLYNRGLLAAAQSDWEVAVETYTRSLALRANATVRSALARASASITGGDAGDSSVEHLAGFALDHDDVIPVLHTADLAELQTALASAFRGRDDFGGGPELASDTHVTVISTLTDASHPEIIFLAVDTPDYPISTERVVIAVRTSAGFMLMETATGGADQTDHGTFGGTSLENLEASWSGDMLRIEMSSSGSSGYVDEAEPPEDAGEDVRCNVFDEERSESSTLVFCRTVPQWSCYALLGTGRELGGTTERVCEDDSGARADLDEVETSPASPPSEIDYQIDPNGITVTATRGAFTFPLAVGTHGWDELARYGLAFDGRSDEGLAIEAAEWAEEDDEMDGAY